MPETTPARSLGARLKGWLVLNFYRLYLLLERILAKKALALRWKIAGVLDLLIRVRGPNRYLAGANDDDDLIIEFAVRKLCDLPPLDRLATRAAAKQEIIEREAREAQNVALVLELQADYFRLGAYFYAITKKPDEAAKLMARAKEIIPSVSELKHGDLNVLEKKVKRLYRDTRRVIADRQSLKLDISGSNFGPLISLLSTLFLLSGYLYNRFYYGYFGVDVVHFFALTDYLGASIEKVRYAATGAAVGLAFIFLGAYSASRRSKYERPTERQDRWEQSLFWSFVSILYGSTGIAYMRDDESWPRTFLTALIVSSLPFSAYLADRFFVHYRQALFCITFVCSFSAHLATSVMADILAIEAASPRLPRAISFRFSQPAPYVIGKTVLMGANSNYLFFYDESIAKVFAMPRSTLLYAKE